MSGLYIVPKQPQTTFALPLGGGFGFVDSFLALLLLAATVVFFVFEDDAANSCPSSFLSKATAFTRIKFLMSLFDPERSIQGQNLGHH